MAIGIITTFFIITGKDLSRFLRLDPRIQRKLGLLEYHMAVVSKLSQEELHILCTLPDEELQRFNTIHDYSVRIARIREKIRETT
ncbi:MAG: hypothetical protein LBT39_03765 [Treponema sp.]|nr:hypothetical protein [Treponema sp.]